MTDPVIDNPTPDNSGGNDPKPDLKKAAKTFTQEELDELMAKRAERAEKATAAKFQKQIDELQAKIADFEGKDLGELEKLQKKLEKATKDLADKETELTGTTLKLAKITALLKAGAQPDKLDGLIKRVAGTTSEEIEADVQELVSLGWIGQVTLPDTTKPAANGSGKVQPKDGLKKFTKAQLESMKPEEYEANRAEILKAMEAGLIT